MPEEERSGDRTPTYPISSVDNALRLLLLFRDQQQLRLSDVSTQLGVSPSTAHRLLAMLMRHGFVHQRSERGAYMAGPALLEIGYGAVRSIDLRGIAQPVLDRLASTIDETVHLAQLEGGHVRYIAGAESTRALRVANRTGELFDAHRTATGRAILAGLTPAQLAEVLATASGTGTGLPETEARALADELDAVRARGYAINHRADGITSVAVAVRNQRGLTVAALNASAPDSRMDSARLEEVLAALVGAAGELRGLLAAV